MCRFGFKRCIGWAVIALGAGLLLTLLPAGLLVLIIGAALILFGCKMLFR